MPREYDTTEESLIVNCAEDCYRSIVDANTTRVSKWFQSGGDLIRVSVSVYSAAELATRKQQAAPKKPKLVKKKGAR